MKPSEHVAYGGAASLLILPAVGPQAALFFAGSVLIDVDHYIDYLYFARFRDWSPFSMLRFHGRMAKHKRDPRLLALEAFHTAEFFAAFLAAGLFFRSAPLLLIFAGMAFHIALDLYRLMQQGAVRVRALSFFEYAVRASRMRRQGIDPEALFFQGYEEMSASEFEPAREGALPGSVEIEPSI